MSPKSKAVFVCSECGAESPKWYGRCPNCGAWNTLEELEMDIRTADAAYSGKPLSSKKLTDIETDDQFRYHTGSAELDRVLGGGIVRGGLMLIGGDPGIGKSTLLLQICSHLGEKHKILYVSGEESEGQLKLRAERLQVSSDNLYILCENSLDAILQYIQTELPEIIIIDSIQTMNLAEIASAAGSVTQVRESTSAIMRVVKCLNIPTFIVGHVNKDGAIAGPKVMEHIVDCVLYFEGDRHSSYRLLRCVKNRYGSTNEVGVFEMTNDGLREVENPSMMLLSGRPSDVSGSCVGCTIEGTRPLLAEIQGLVSPTGYGNPRRMSTGFDYNRLSLLLAVLEKRAGYYFSNQDTFVNVVGGLWLEEPAIDLPVAIALISSLKDAVIPASSMAFGEIGLTGELRSVSDADQRIAEAARLGFKKVIVPFHNLRTLKKRTDIQIVGAHHVREAYEEIQKETE